jgi:hypothetical protein
MMIAHSTPEKGRESNPITMVNKRHIWAQPSTHDGRHANMMGADVVRCNQCMVPRTRYQIKYDLLNLVLSAIVTNNREAALKKRFGGQPPEYLPYPHFSGKIHTRNHVLPSSRAARNGAASKVW